MARAVRLLLAAGLALSASGAAAAEDPSASFPNRPIRMIVPFPAGGPSDIVARLIGQTMSQDWGQPVVIENRPGANTIIGAQAAAKASPDGYTLFMAFDSTLVMNQFVHKSLPYERLRADHADRKDHLGAGGFSCEGTQERHGADGTREGAAG